MNTDHDIVWIQSAPAVAAVYFHENLKRTHVLYCPDDTVSQDQLHIRELARNILFVVDSNNKKIAVHFMQPCQGKKRQDLLKFLVKRRPLLRIDCLVIPTTHLQTQLLSGWAQSITDQVWQRRCTVPYNSEAFVSIDTTNGETQYQKMDLFLVSNETFVKKALLVNITGNMCRYSDKSGFILNDNLTSAIQGWMDVASDLQNPTTVALIAKERDLYGNIAAFEHKSGKEKANILSKHRHSVYSALEKIGNTLPIYLYAIDYQRSEDIPLERTIAWLQHRHHLCLARSVLLSGSETSSSCSEYPELFAKMTTINLNKSERRDRKRWKAEFMKTMQSAQFKEGHDDSLRYILPSRLDIKQIDRQAYLTPLLAIETNQKTISEQVSNVAIHSVSASHTDIFKKWKSVALERCKGSMLDQEMVSSYQQQGTTDVERTGSVDENEREDIDPSTLSLMYSDNMNDVAIKEYINNQGAYSRGEGILHTLTDLFLYGNSRRLHISGHAKGTVSVPYDVSATLKRKGDDKIEFSDSHCSCPAGKQGKCKHVVALLMRFMVNGDDFEVDAARQSQAAKSAAETPSETEQKPVVAPPVTVKSPPADEPIFSDTLPVDFDMDMQEPAGFDNDNNDSSVSKDIHDAALRSRKMSSLCDPESPETTQPLGDMQEAITAKPATTFTPEQVKDDNDDDDGTASAASSTPPPSPEAKKETRKEQQEKEKAKPSSPVQVELPPPAAPMSVPRKRVLPWNREPPAQEKKRKGGRTTKKDTDTTITVKEEKKKPAKRNTTDKRGGAATTTAGETKTKPGRRKKKQQQLESEEEEKEEGENVSVDEPETLSAPPRRGPGRRARQKAPIVEIDMDEPESIPSPQPSSVFRLDEEKPAQHSEEYQHEKQDIIPEHAQDEEAEDSDATVDGGEEDQQVPARLSQAMSWQVESQEQEQEERKQKLKDKKEEKDVSMMTTDELFDSLGL